VCHGATAPLKFIASGWIWQHYYEWWTRWEDMIITYLTYYILIFVEELKLTMRNTSARIAGQKIFI
jgi:hypothetical protein